MTVFPDSSQSFSRKQTLSTIVPALPQNQQKTVRKRTVMQRLMCGFRLHVAPHVSDISENEPKHWNSQLPVVLSFFRFDSCADIASSNQPLLGAGVRHCSTPA